MPGSEMSRRAAAWTKSPASRNARAVARPMPDDAPITTTERLLTAPPPECLKPDGRCRAYGGQDPSRREEDLELGRGRAAREPGELLWPVFEREHVREVLAERRPPADEPLVGLLEVRHRVGVGALDPVLAADHAVKAERRVVGGEPDAHERPAWSQQLEAQGARGLGADGRGRPAGLARVLGLLGRRVDGVGAELRRPRAALV